MCGVGCKALLNHHAVDSVTEVLFQ